MYNECVSLTSRHRKALNRLTFHYDQFDKFRSISFGCWDSLNYVISFCVFINFLLIKKGFRLDWTWISIKKENVEWERNVVIILSIFILFFLKLIHLSGT